MHKDPWEMVEPPRTVLPRARKFVHMEIAAYHDGRIYSETGNVFDHAPTFVTAAPPTVIVTVDPSGFLATLHAYLKDDPHWRYTLYRVHSDYGDLGSVSRVKLSTFGMRCTCDRDTQGPVCRRPTRKGRMHQCWDPRTVSPDASARFIDDADPATLLAWATDVRTWAQENQLELRNAYAGYGAQLLRDPRFYDEPRRRVPRATNENVRPQLPGNLITLHADTGPTTYQVTCIDQKSAHHRVVQETPLPSANHLFARGYFVEPEAAPEPWTRLGDDLFARVLQQHKGLLYVGMYSRLSTPKERGLRLPLQEFTGYQRGYVWTNTLSFLESGGTHIDAIFAAWTSTSTDTGLSRYGHWAENQISHSSPARRRWLKPLLHSTYGLLAARPRPLEVGHHGPDDREAFLLGAREFPVRAVKLNTVTPVFVNVVQRGMIEAETQIRSLQMARLLTDAGCRVLHIHSDGLHVQGDLPLLPASWSISNLTDVVYLDRVSWVARERTCLPGRDEQARHELVVHYGRLHSAIRERGAGGRLRRYLQRTHQ